MAVIVWPLVVTVQPLTVPLSAAVGVSPAGSVSMTVTLLPSVAAAPTLLTVIV